MGKKSVKITDSVKKNVWNLVAVNGMIIVAGHLCLQGCHAIKMVPSKFSIKKAIGNIKVQRSFVSHSPFVHISDNRTELHMVETISLVCSHFLSFFI